MSGMNTDVKSGISLLVPTQPAASVPVNETDSPVGHVANRSIATGDKTAPPPPTSQGKSALSKFLAANKREQSGKSGNRLRDFLNNSDRSTKSDNDRDLAPKETKPAKTSALRSFMDSLSASKQAEDSNLDGVDRDNASVVSHDTDTATDEDVTLGGIQPSYFGALGKHMPPHDKHRSVSPFDRVPAATERSKPQKYWHGKRVFGGDIARQIKTIVDSEPENAYKRQGGLPTAGSPPNVKKMVADIQARTPSDLKETKPDIIDIPGRADGAFARAKESIINGGKATGDTDQAIRQEKIDGGPSVGDIVKNWPPKR